MRWHPRSAGELPVAAAQGRLAAQQRGEVDPVTRRRADRERFRVDKTFGLEWSRQRAWRDRYAGARLPREPELLERRVDVALHRSGLRNSIRAGRQVVSAGLARVNGVGVRPGQRLYAGDRVTRERWPEWAARACAQFARWTPGRCRPLVPWLEVDWTTGAFVRVYEPTRDELYRPRSLLSR